MAYDPKTAITGLHPVRNPSGTSPSVSEYTVAATYASNIGEGCLVRWSATGGVRLVDATTAATQTVIGVAAQNLTSNSGAGARIKVYDDPNQVYTILSNTNINAATVVKYEWGYANMADNTYNATLGYGKTRLAVTNLTNTTTAGVPLRIVGRAYGPNHELTTNAATNSIFYVKLARLNLRD